LATVRVPQHRRPTGAPAFSVSIERIRGTVHLRCIGDLDEAGALVLSDAFASVSGNSLRAVRVDCTGVRFIDSSGVHALLECAGSCAGAAVRLSVVASAPVRQVLSLLEVGDAVNLESDEGAFPS
jgi:anti-anti-sigma factor